MEVMNKVYILETLESIKLNVTECCGITMEPDQIIELIDILKEYIENQK